MKSAYLGGQAGCASDANTAVQITEIDLFKNRLHELLNFVGNQGEDLDRLANKLTGGGEPDCKPATPRPVPNGDIGSMNMLLDDVMSRLHRTGDAVLRLSRAI